ncbi:MAG: transaldolase family protein [Patescibacteria group bacterium]
MKLFIDSANLDEIKAAVSWGIIDGCTTNPTLAAKNGVHPVRSNPAERDAVPSTERTSNGVNDFLPTAQQILKTVPGPVSFEALSQDSTGMIREGAALAKLGKNVVVKLPTTVEGLKACRTLVKKKIPVNMTLVFSPLQALLVAKAGATYVSPFVGRIDDAGHDGNEVVQEIIEIYNNYGFETQIIYASVRSPLHVRQAALMGCDIATCPFAVLEKLSEHPLTAAGLNKFLSDWKKSGVKPLV